MKKCKTCGIEKELNEFIKNCGSKDGVTTHCRHCIKLKRDSKSMEEKEIIITRSKLWVKNIKKGNK